MEQQACLTSQLTTSEFASLPSTEESSDPSSRHGLLELEAQVVDFVSNYTIRGVLEGFTPGEVTILLGEPISEQRSVTVRLDSFTFEGQTLYCRPRQDGYEAHVSIDDVETTGLRRAPRFPVKLPARLLLRDASSVLITILDISRDGVGIELPISVETGQAIAVECGSVFVFAVVRHCRELPSGLFHAGAEMHHLFEKPVAIPADAPRSTFLSRIRGRRSVKGEARYGARLAPRLL
jgi:PilZ domain